jgi:hypothetical protein
MTDIPTDRRRRTGGPPLVLVAGVSTALVATAVLAQRLLTGGDVYPRAFADANVVTDYFSAHPDVARLTGTLQFGAAVPLAVYSATAYSQMRSLGVRVAGVTIALAGGLLAAGFLALSGLLQWTLGGSTTAGDALLAVHATAFVTGGPGHVVFLGLLIAGLTVPALIMRLLPRWLAIAGLVIAVTAELTTLALLVRPLEFLLPVARVVGLAWLIAAGALLPTARRGRRAAPPNTS